MTSNTSAAYARMGATSGSDGIDARVTGPRRSAFTLVMLSLVLALLSACGSGSDEDNDGYTGSITASQVEGFAPLAVDLKLTDLPDDTGYSGGSWDFGDGERTSSLNFRTSVSHTYDEHGKYTVTATLPDYNGNTYQVSKTIVVHSRANLVVSNFAASSMLIPGQDNTISATIRNVGTDRLTCSEQRGSSCRIHVGYYLSKDGEITVDDMLIGDTTMHINADELDPDEHALELGPQETYTYNHRLHLKTNIPAGHYFIGAIVDHLGFYEWDKVRPVTDTEEYSFPEPYPHILETDEGDNVSALLKRSVIGSEVCQSDLYEDNDVRADANELLVGSTQQHTLCFDNSDWYRFQAVKGEVSQITTTEDGAAVDERLQLFLYDPEGKPVLFDERNGAWSATAPEIVWKATATGEYLLKVRVKFCDEDECGYSAHGVGSQTEYSISLQ